MQPKQIGVYLQTKIKSAMLAFIDKESEEALCVLLNEEREQFEEWSRLQEVESYLSNQHDCSPE